MLFGDKRVKSLPLYSVSGVTCQHTDFLHALSHCQIFHRGSVSALFAFKTFHKSPQSLFAQYISSSTTHIALLGVRLKPSAKINGLLWCMICKKPSEVVHNDIGVIICLEEPVCLVSMMLIGIMKGPDRFPVQLVPTLFGTQTHCGEVRVIDWAHEYNDITVATPCGFDVTSLLLQVVRTSHHPTKNAYLFVEFICHTTVFTCQDKVNVYIVFIIILHCTKCRISLKTNSKPKKANKQQWNNITWFILVINSSKLRLT